jgi:hypothetical protein
MNIHFGYKEWVAHLLSQQSYNQAILTESLLQMQITPAVFELLCFSCFFRFSFYIDFWTLPSTNKSAAQT